MGSSEVSAPKSFVGNGAGGPALRPADLLRIVWLDLTRSMVGCWRGFLTHPFSLSVVSETLDAETEIALYRPQLLCLEAAELDASSLARVAALARRHEALRPVAICHAASSGPTVRQLRSLVCATVLPPFNGAALRHQLLRLAGLVAEAGTESRSHARTAPALDLVTHRFPAPVTVVAAAQCCRLSVSQFSRLFRREHGQPFKQFLVGYRIDRACERIADSDAPLKQVVFDVGFNDCAYFSRVFRQRVGVSPRDFRAAAQRS